MFTVINPTQRSETIQVDWYKLLCDLFNEEYKDNLRVANVLQKVFFQDIKGDIAGQFNNFVENHFDEISGKILSKLERIEGKQDFLKIKQLSSYKQVRIY